ncbi:MAG: steryl acetyl hydrolase, partial [Pseudomonadales bacterium]
GLEDAVAAYRHLLEVEGVAPEEIMIAGDSAGGGLSLSLLLSIREQGLPMPLCACLFSPFTDASLSSPSLKYNRWLDPLLPAGRMSSMSVYFGDTPLDHPLISPVNASYEDFPPILAQVSSTETLLDDTLRTARRAREQDAKFEVEVWQGMPHVFQIFGFLPEAGEAQTHAVEFIRKQMPAKGTRKKRAA